MSSKIPNRIKQALSLRLTWYFGLFTLAGFVLFGATYASLSSYLRHQDRRTLATELAALADGYHRGGLQAIQDKIAAQDRAGAAPFFVRIVAPDRTSVFVHFPPQWDEAFDLDRLSRVDAAESWVEIPSKDPEEQETLEITGTRLSDGTSLQVGLNSEGRLDLLEQIRNALAVAMIGVIAISLAAGAFLAVRALRPLRDLLAVLRSITATGALDARAPVAGTGDELDELSRLFNTLLGRIELLIAGMRDTLDTVAHDLRTPMTRLRGTAEMALRSNAPPDQLREALATCIEESDQILAMLNTLMDISEAETGAMKLDLEPVNIREVVERIVALYGDVAAEKNIGVAVAVPPDLAIASDRNRMLQVLANLIDNAVKYTPRNGRIEIAAALDQGRIVIAVTDTGAGIPADELPRIWDRLFRGAASRSQRGLGLGLSFVKAIVQAHRGSVEAVSLGAQGSRFTISLPT